MNERVLQSLLWGIIGDLFLELAYWETLDVVVWDLRHFSFFDFGNFGLLDFGNFGWLTCVPWLA